jgi:hypothetical protein
MRPWASANTPMGTIERSMRLDMARRQSVECAAWPCLPDRRIRLGSTAHQRLCYVVCIKLGSSLWIWPPVQLRKSCLAHWAMRLSESGVNLPHDVQCHLFEAALISHGEQTRPQLAVFLHEKHPRTCASLKARAMVEPDSLGG